MMLSQYEFIDRFVPALMAAYVKERLGLSGHDLDEIAHLAIGRAEAAWGAYRRSSLALDLAAHREIDRAGEAAEGMSRSYSSVPEMVRDMAEPEFADEFDRMIGEKLRVQEAARDMLKALQNLVSEMGDNAMMVIDRGDLEEARAAIARATGDDRP